MSDSSFVDAWRRLLEKGVSAPSGDNCQPWAFRLEGQELLVIADHVRGKHFFNVAGRADYVALGALLENLDLAASAEGHGLKIEIFPRGEQDGVAAAVRIAPGARPADPLHAAIGARCTNRKRYERRSLDAQTREALFASVGGAGRLALVEESSLIDRAARLASLPDRLMAENYWMHRSLFAWIRWNRRQVEGTRDGLDIRTLELNAPARLGFSFFRFWPVMKIVAQVGVGRAITEIGYRNYRCSGAIGLLRIPDTSARSFLSGGRLLQRIWLAAAARQVSFQPLAGISIAIQKVDDESGADIAPRHRAMIARAKKEIDDIFPSDGAGVPMMMFRVGFSAPPSARSLRRPVEVAS